MGPVESGLAEIVLLLILFSQNAHCFCDGICWFDRVWLYRVVVNRGQYSGQRFLGQFYSYSLSAITMFNSWVLLPSCRYRRQALQGGL